MQISTYTRVQEYHLKSAMHTAETFDGHVRGAEDLALIASCAEFGYFRPASSKPFPK
jgi:hypothetical protein